MEKEKGSRLNYFFEIGVKAIIENPQGAILVVKDASSANWTLPGGRIRPEETPRQALAREIKEETGLRVMNTEEPRSIWFFSPHDDLRHQVILLNYRCQVDKANLIKLSEECSDFAWVMPRELLTLPLPHESLKYAIGQEYGFSLQPSQPTKLVRDKIPEIMRNKGQGFRTKKLTDQEYSQALLVKLTEETREVASAKTKAELINELADVLEVVEAILETESLPFSQVKKVQLEKRKKSGGFKQKLLLLPPLPLKVPSRD